MADKIEMMTQKAVFTIKKMKSLKFKDIYSAYCGRTSLQLRCRRAAGPGDC